jgi:hypothetical protein
MSSSVIDEQMPISSAALSDCSLAIASNPVLKLLVDPHRSNFAEQMVRLPGNFPNRLAEPDVLGDRNRGGVEAHGGNEPGQRHQRMCQQAEWRGYVTWYTGGIMDMACMMIGKAAINR